MEPLPIHSSQRKSSQALYPQMTETSAATPRAHLPEGTPNKNPHPDNFPLYGWGASAPLCRHHHRRDLAILHRRSPQRAPQRANSRTKYDRIFALDSPYKAIDRSRSESQNQRSAVVHSPETTTISHHGTPAAIDEPEAGLARVCSMPAEFVTFDLKLASLGAPNDARKLGRSDPEGREERVELDEEEDEGEMKRSEAPTVVSEDEEDTIFMNPAASTIGRLNCWDSSSTQYLQKMWRSAKSEKGTSWTRSVEAYLDHRLLQSLEPDQPDPPGFGYTSSSDASSSSGSEGSASSGAPKRRRRRRNRNSASNLPSDWFFVPRRINSSASLWVLVGTSVRRRFVSDISNTDRIL